MTLAGAFFGGFHSFFSIWISCLMQVIPFLLAFLAASSVREADSGPGVRWKDIALDAAALFLGFIVLFSAIGMVTTGISKTLFKYMEILNQFGGVIIGLTGLYFLGLLTLKTVSGGFYQRMQTVAGFFVGASLAIAYKPCVTPALTVIFSINTSPENAAWGGALLFAYALGISSAVLLFGIPLAGYASKLKSAKSRSIAKKVCGGLLVVVALLILTDKMTEYKSLLVGGFVPSANGEHHHDAMPEEHQMPAGHEHMDHGE